MTERRFTDKPDLDPSAVRSLPDGHPALVENRTLFPSTVVEITEDFPDRLLVSGRENRKLGETVVKGAFKGYGLYGLSLEERATCPTDCSVRSFCYGNGMQLARRHRIGDVDLFFTFLESEIRELLAQKPNGVLIRLHVLGDFPSVEYVAFWSDMLAEHPKLACYGYTHRQTRKWGGEDDIGDAIDAVKNQHPDRFRIRWSAPISRPDGARVIDFVPGRPRVEQGLVCPAQTDATACCASCGLCWEPGARNDTIVFIKHGPKSIEAAAENARPNIAGETIRPVASIPIPQRRDAVLSKPPEMRLVAPADLRIESNYQRDLSGKSIKLIRKIVLSWDWTKFKPPIVVDTPDGLFVIDGQHTAIAAASHPEIKTIPVMIVPAAHIERRAEAFVAHNRDRLAMTPAQVFYGELAAKNKEAREIMECIVAAGASLPRIPVNKKYAKPGQIVVIGALRETYGFGKVVLTRVLSLAVKAGVAPISEGVIRGVRITLVDPEFAKLNLTDEQIVGALRSLKELDLESRNYAAQSGQPRTRACAWLIAKAARPDLAEAA